MICIFICFLILFTQDIVYNQQIYLMICHSLLPCIFCQFWFARLLRCSLPLRSSSASHHGGTVGDHIRRYEENSLPFIEERQGSSPTCRPEGIEMNSIELRQNEALRETTSSVRETLRNRQ